MTLLRITITYPSPTRQTTGPHDTTPDPSRVSYLPGSGTQSNSTPHESFIRSGLCHPRVALGAPRPHRPTLTAVFRSELWQRFRVPPLRCQETHHKRNLRIPTRSSVHGLWRAKIFRCTCGCHTTRRSIRLIQSRKTIGSKAGVTEKRREVLPYLVLVVQNSVSPPEERKVVSICVLGKTALE